MENPLTLSWERVAGPKALTGVGRYSVGPGPAPLPPPEEAFPSGEGGTPQGVTDEGPHPNNETGHIEWETLPFNVACFSLFGCFPSSVPGYARSTFPAGEGDLPAGAFIPSPRGRSRALTSKRHRERCSPRRSLPDPGSWPGSSRWAPWPPGLWTSPGSCGPGT